MAAVDATNHKELNSEKTVGADSTMQLKARVAIFANDAATIEYVMKGVSRPKMTAQLREFERWVGKRE